MVASNKHEACLALDAILTENRYGKAGQTVVVEELLQGEEVSVIYNFIYIYFKISFYLYFNYLLKFI